MTEDGWGEVSTSSSPVKAIKKIGPSQPQQYKWKRGEIKILQKYPSTIYPENYKRGCFYGFVGVPGSGKTRAAIQECLLSKDDCLYLYNESSRQHFDNYVMKIADELRVEPTTRLTFCDMSEFLQKIASYDGIETFYDKIWVQQIRYWLESVKNPGIVVTDSFSNIGRRYIPQLWEAHQSYVSGLTELSNTITNPPVFIEVHQKSGGHYDRMDDSVVGGFGLVHQLDAILVFKYMDVSQWDAKRYGLKEGTSVYFLQCTKDRNASGTFEQKRIILKDGRLQITKNISDMSQRDGPVTDW